MKNLFIVDIEPLDNRYTKQWFTWIPELARKTIGDKFRVVPVSGHATAYDKPTAGAFFDFSATCEYKASQAVEISKLFSSGVVGNGDVFFFTDAWNQTVHTVKYISELNGIDVKLVGIFHAGAYDPTDILALRIKNKDWVKELERSYASAFDMMFFATEQHKDKFLNNLEINNPKYHSKSYVCGYPLEYIADLRNNNEKKNIVVFPHRINSDKAPEIFDSLRTYVNNIFSRTDIEFVKTQELNMNKEEYYEYLQQCKVIFSANKHENLGIGTFEAMTAGCLPLVPNKLSYAEMYSDDFLYNMSSNFYEYPGLYLEPLAQIIIYMVDNYTSYKEAWGKDVVRIQQQFFSGEKMMELIGKA
jgi:hypothetical protein